MDHALKKRGQDMDAQLKEADMAEKRETQRVEQARAAAAAAEKPTNQGVPK
jgi:hypothetical protein